MSTGPQKRAKKQDNAQPPQASNTGSVKIKIVPSSSNLGESSSSTNIVLNGQGLLSTDSSIQGKQPPQKEKKSRKRSEKKESQSKASLHHQPTNIVPTMMNDLIQVNTSSFKVISNTG